MPYKAYTGPTKKKKPYLPVTYKGSPYSGVVGGMSPISYANTPNEYLNLSTAAGPIYVPPPTATAYSPAPLSGAKQSTRSVSTGGGSAYTGAASRKRSKRRSRAGGKSRRYYPSTGRSYGGGGYSRSGKGYSATGRAGGSYPATGGVTATMSPDNEAYLRYGITPEWMKSYQEFWGSAYPEKQWPLFQPVMQLFSKYQGRMPQIEDWRKMWQAIKTQNPEATSGYFDIAKWEPIVANLMRPPLFTPPQVAYSPRLSF